MSSIGLREGGPAIAVGMILDGRLRVVGQYYLLPRVADGHGLETVGKVECASRSGTGGGRVVRTNSNEREETTTMIRQTSNLLKLLETMERDTS